MLTFKTFLIEKSIRQGLPHISTMDYKQFGSLIKGGQVHLHHATEKTDAMSHLMGHDEKGFYTQSSGSSSEKMRKPGDFYIRAKKRAAETGKPYNPAIASAFANVHKQLALNPGITSHLKATHEKTHSDVKIRGEVFYKPLAKPSEVKGEVKFVGTYYSPSHMGSMGKYVVHSKLPENQHLDAKHVSKFSTPEINFDNDTVKFKPVSLDVSKEHRAFSQLNHGVLSSRTTSVNRATKAAEQEKLTQIKASVSSKVDSHIASAHISPKWGSGSEGLVIHPSASNPEAPRFKVTSAAFKAYRASPDSRFTK